MKRALASEAVGYLPRKSRFRAFLNRVYEYRVLYLFLAPVLLWYLLFAYQPMYGIQIAFKDFSVKKGITGSDWVGFEHFEKMFTNREFYRVLRNTLTISGLKLCFVSTSGIVFALFLNEIRHARFKKIVQNISYLPHFLSWVIICSILTELLSPSTGIVNKVIVRLGGKEIFFLGDRQWFVPIVIMADVWQSCGWGAIIYLAAISGIEPELYEAATIDGAHRGQLMRHITLPSIMSVITIMMIMNVGNIMNAGFDQILNMYNKRVYEVGDILDTFVYRNGVTKMDYDYSTAVGLFKNVVGLVLVVITNKAANRMGQTGLW